MIVGPKKKCIKYQTPTRTAETLMVFQSCSNAEHKITTQQISAGVLHPVSRARRLLMFQV